MMDIQQLIETDRDLLLNWNGSDSLFWDGFMWIVSDTKTWALAAVMLLYIIFKNTKLAHGMLILVMLALTITLADQFASGICKPFFERVFIWAYIIRVMCCAELFRDALWLRWSIGYITQLKRNISNVLNIFQGNIRQAGLK